MALLKQEEKNCCNWFVTMALPKQKEKRKKKLWQLICGNGIAEIGRKKKLLLLVYGNGIAEIEGKKNCGNGFVAIALPKQKGKKKFVAIDLPKIGGERELFE